MSSELLSNKGYLAVKKESTYAVPVTPNDFIPVYDDSLTTNGNLVDIDPIYGNNFATYSTIQGQRSHRGDITCMAEPNTTARLADMLFRRSSTTGSGPYTHIFVHNGDSNSYTVDLSSGEIVRRYWGVKASNLSPDWNENEMRWKISVSAAGSFQGREISSISTVTLTLKTDYDPNPTLGLVAGDKVRVYKKSTGATLDATVSSITNGTVVVLDSSAAAFAAGDMIYLRPDTPSFNLLSPFMWAKTQFRTGADASAAASATHVPLDRGSTYELMHNFNNEDGEMRSGSFDPSSLARTTSNASLNLKKFFSTVDDVTYFNNLAKQAWVVKHLAGSTNQYEARITFNNVKTDTPAPVLKSGELQYSELTYHPNYDSSDGQAFGLTVINGLSSI